MTVSPPWADAALSMTLPDLVLGGESQFEFKREFPKQATDLAKEIAGFATSNAGVIYLGVDDDCDIVGLDASDAEQRAKLVQRIEGICAQVIKPPITPSILFALIGDKIVLAIHVPKGSQPIYFVGGIPYLRQITAARPMSPDEVTEAVLAWKKGEPDPTPEAIFIASLAHLIASAEIALFDCYARPIGPWYEDVKYRLSDIADRARDLAEETPYEMEAALPTLEAFAEACDVLANERPAVRGPSLEIAEAQHEAEDAVTQLRRRWLGPGRLSEAHAEHQRETVGKCAKLLADLVQRIEADPRGQKEDILQAEVGQRGMELSFAAALRVGMGDEARREALWLLGVELRALEIRRIPSDGWRSFDALLDDIRALNQRLQAWVHAWV